MKTFVLNSFVIACIAGIPAACLAQNTVKERLWEYWGQKETYLDHQADVILGLVDETLLHNPSSPTPSAERQLALAALDAVVHDTRNDDSPQLHAFIDRRVARLAKELDIPVKKGLRISKIYNDAFIVQSKSCTVGFDLCGTRKGMKIVPDSLMREIVSRCAMLFISHRDSDHADKNVVAMAAEMNIPVYSPEDYDNGQVIKIRTEDFGEQPLKTASGTEILVRALPGHQDKLQNNIYVVAFPEGQTVVHCGDQYKKEDLEWLRNASAKLSRRPDVLIIDCWAMEMKETILGFNPKLVISGHEDEMGHSIDHREAFWLTQYKLDEMTLPVPTVILAWGESFTVRK